MAKLQSKQQKTSESGLIEALRVATQNSHSELEELMYSKKLRDLSLSEREYIHLLKTNFVYFLSFEHYCSNSTESRQFHMVKSDLAEKDLVQLGAHHGYDMSIPSLSKYTWTPSRQAGHIYVALGSQLGSNMIARLIKQLPFTKNAFQFYGSSKDFTRLWREFLAYLNSGTNLNKAEVVEGGLEGFDMMKQIFLNTKDLVPQ